MNKTQYTIHTVAPFHSDGHGINDAEGQRVATVSMFMRSQDREEYDQLTDLFAAAPEMQLMLAEVHAFLALKETVTIEERYMQEKIKKVLVNSNKDYQW